MAGGASGPASPPRAASSPPEEDAPSVPSRWQIRRHGRRARAREARGALAARFDPSDTTHWAVSDARHRREATRRRVRAAMLAPWDDDGAGGLRLVIDCGMDDLMTDGERRSLTVQIQLGYAAALRAALGPGDEKGDARSRRDGDPDDVEPAAPARILLSSVAGRFEAALDRDSGSASWPLRRSRKPFDEAALDAVAPGRGGEADEADDRAVDVTNDQGGPASPLRPRPRLVFLSPDAPTALTSAPDRSAVYVIGGLCDYKRLKRATLDRAERAGIDAARLPILESLGANAPVNVLTVDQCVEALAIADRTRGDWARALRTVLPARKLREMDRRLEERRGGGGGEERGVT